MAGMSDCSECLRPFKPILPEQMFCCRPCAQKYYKRLNKIKDKTGEPIQRLCVVCQKVWFIPRNSVHKMCSEECRKEEVRSVAYAYWVAHKQKVKAKEETIACIRCAHWQKRADSDNGGECLIGRWRLCKPYLSTTKPFKLREEKQSDLEEPDQQA